MAYDQLAQMSPQELTEVEEGCTPHSELRKRMASQHPIHGEFAKAYENLGGTVGLTDWAQDNQSSFYKLWARLAPAPQAVKHSGELNISLSLQRNPHLDDFDGAQDADFDEVP